VPRASTGTLGIFAERIYTMLPPINFLLAVAILFGSWIFVIRWLTGWSALEGKYRCDRQIPAQWISNGSYRWIGASLRASGLALSIEIYPKALWLKAGFPLSIGLRPLCIPWSAVESVTQKRSFLQQKTSLKVVGIGSPIHIWGRAGAKIFEAVRQFKTSP
jgi:hypothetical protein